MAQADFIFEALKTLTKKRKAVFETLYEQQRYGWEKWLQVELAFALKDSGVPEFEVAYDYDQHRLKPLGKKNFKKGFLDIQFRANGHLLDHPTAIEIKVNNTEKGFRGVLSDLIKIGAVRDLNGDWKFRCVTVIFIHGNYGSKIGKFKLIKDKLIEEKLARVHCTGNPGYEMIILGWEKNHTANMTRDNYLKWVAKVAKIYSEFGVEPKTTHTRNL